MQVTQTNSTATSGAASPSATRATNTLGSYDSFLQLLVTELRNQDPTKPMDPSETVSQLATFSSVEQAVRTNALLETALANSSLSQAASLVGRTVTMADGSTGGVVKAVTLSGDAMVATLRDGRSIALSDEMTIS